MPDLIATCSFTDRVAADVIKTIREEVGNADSFTDQEAINQGFKNYLSFIYQRRMRRIRFPAAAAPFRAILEKAKVDSEQALVDIKAVEATINEQIEADFT